MNQNLFQLNDNCGIVSDEKGNTNLIKKENNSYQFDEILLKENEIERLRNKLSDCKDKLSLNKQNIIYGEIASIFLIVLEIFMFGFLHSTVPIKKLLFIMAISYLPLKAIITLTYGTRIGKHNKKIKLNGEIEKIESDIPTLEKELDKIKEKSKYKVERFAFMENNNKSNDNEICHEASLIVDDYIKKDKNKVKILSLTKK